jgi:uncharacterized lipoprotein YajG
LKCLLFAGLAFLAGCATAEPQVQKTTRALAALQSCGSIELIDENLSTQYQEKRAEIGLMQDGNTLVTLYTSGGGKTWTIVLTTPNRISCLHLAGYHWADAAN